MNDQEIDFFISLKESEDGKDFELISDIRIPKTTEYENIAESIMNYADYDKNLNIPMKDRLLNFALKESDESTNVSLTSSLNSPVSIANPPESFFNSPVSITKELSKCAEMFINTLFESVEQSPKEIKQLLQSDEIKMILKQKLLKKENIYEPQTKPKQFSTIMKGIFFPKNNMPNILLLEYLNLKKEDINNFLDYLVEVYILLIDPNYHLIIQVGIGGTEDEVNARLPSYITFGIRFLRIMTTYNKNIKLKVFSAHNLRKVLCNLNEARAELVEKNAKKNLKFFQEFVEYFFKDLQEYIDYETDSKEGLREVVIPLAQEWIAKNEANFPPNFKKGIRSMSETHESDINESYSYAFAHVCCGELIFNGKMPIKFVNVKKTEETAKRDMNSGLLWIGGSAERVFGEGMKNAKEFLTKYYPENTYLPEVVHLISQSGSNGKPVYYNNENDVNLKKYIEKEKVDGKEKDVKQILLCLHHEKEWQQKKSIKRDKQNLFPEEFDEYKNFLKNFVQNNE